MIGFVRKQGHHVAARAFTSTGMPMPSCAPWPLGYIRIPVRAGQCTPWFPAAEDRVMTMQEIAERLCEIQGDRTPYLASFTLIARAAGLSRETVYVAARGEMGDHAQRRIGEVLRRLDACELRFERHGNYWREVEPPPVEGLPRQRRIVKVREFTPWAPCEGCRGRDWTPVVLIDKAHGYVCRRCIPADQLPAFGARLRKP